MKASLGEYLGTRVRLQRLRDYAFFEGWVTQFSSAQLSLRMETMKAVEQGDVFYAELSGRQLMLQFQVQFLNTQDYNVQAAIQMLSNTEATVNFVEAGELDFDFQLITGVSYAPIKEPFRKRIEPVKGEVNWDGLTFEVDVLDVGNQGVGFETDFDFPIESEISLSFNTISGYICLVGRVKRCTLKRGSDGKYIVGAHLLPEGRIEAARWEKFIESCLPI